MTEQQYKEQIKFLTKQVNDGARLIDILGYRLTKASSLIVELVEELEKAKEAIRIADEFSPSGTNIMKAVG